MKHRRAHQRDQGGKDLLALQLRGGEDRLQRGVAFRAPLRTEAVGHFAVNHAGAQGAFAHVVGRGDARIMQEGQEFSAVFREACLQPQRALPRDLLRQQVIQLCVQLFGLRHKRWQAEGGVRAVKLMMQVDRRLEQVLHGLRPGVLGFGVQHALQVAQLMRQTQLKDWGRRFQLRTETVTDPDFNCGVAQDLAQYPRPTT